MPTRMSIAIDWLLMTAALAAAGIVFSEGISFARHMPEIHAQLLATGGVGLFCMALAGCRLLGRIRRLERQIAEAQFAEGQRR